MPPPSSTTVILPSARHRQLLAVLDGMAHDNNGRRVAFVRGFQEALAKRLGLKRRRVQQLIADLRTPEVDPRHPNKPIGKGLHLGALRVEPSQRRKMPDGSTRYGADLYVLLFERGAPSTWPVKGQSAQGQSAPESEPVSAAQAKAHSGRSALGNKRTPSLEEEGELVGVPTEQSYPQAPAQDPAYPSLTPALPQPRELGKAEAARITAAAASWGDVPAAEALALARGAGQGPSKAEVLAALEHAFGTASELDSKPNAWVDRQSTADLRAWHRNLAGSPRRRR